VRGDRRLSTARGGLAAALLCVALPGFCSAGATASVPQARAVSAWVVFVSPGPLPAGHSEDNAIETELSSIPTLSTGILSATQGAYKTDQLLLDITQGARVSYS